MYFGCIWEWSSLRYVSCNSIVSIFIDELLFWLICLFSSFDSHIILRDLYDNVDSKIRKFWSKGNSSWNLPIAWRFSESPGANRRFDCFLVDWINNNLFSWRSCSHISDIETLFVEIIMNWRLKLCNPSFPIINSTLNVQPFHSATHVKTRK